MLVLYLKDVINTAFGSKRNLRMFEFAKSRGQIHFRLCSIRADKRPHKLLREMEGGESQEVADAIAKWAWGPYLSPRCALEIRQRRRKYPKRPRQKAYGPQKKQQRRSDTIPGRRIVSPSPHRVCELILFALAGRILREAPRKGGKKDHPSGASLRGCQMGDGRDAAPRQAGTPGRGNRPLPGI